MGKPEIRSAIVVVRAVGTPVINTKNGPKPQLEVRINGDVKLQTWKVDDYSASAQVLVGSFAAVEYHDKSPARRDEFFLDGIRAATQAEADAYNAGTAPKVVGLTFEAATAPVPAIPAIPAGLPVAAPQLQPQTETEGGRPEAGTSQPAGPAAASRDAQIHAQSAIKAATELLALSGEWDVYRFAMTVKALQRFYASGGDAGKLVELADVLGLETADQIALFGSLHEMDEPKITGYVEKPRNADEQPTYAELDDNQVRVAEEHVHTDGIDVNDAWLIGATTGTVNPNDSEDVVL